jgi:hypothetical protein
MLEQTLDQNGGGLALEGALLDAGPRQSLDKAVDYGKKYFSLLFENNGEVLTQEGKGQFKSRYTSSLYE